MAKMIFPKEATRRAAILMAADQQVAQAPADALTALKADCATPVVCDVAGDWLKEPDEPERPIVSGLIDTGDRSAIVGQSKAKKSFFALQLGLSIASGTPFLGYEVTTKRVLLVNGEIRRAPYKRRLRRMAEGMRLDPASLGGLIVVHLADQVPDDDPLALALRLATDHRCEVVILDPFYTCVGDETDQTEVKRAVAAMKTFAVEGLTLVSVFHASKGSIGDRQAIDRISGSGVFARDTSTMLTLCEHATEADHIVLTSICRNHPPKESKTIYFEEGCFEMTDVAPVEKTSRTKAVRVIPMNALQACFTVEPTNYGDTVRRTQEVLGVGYNVAKAQVTRAVSEGILQAVKRGRETIYTLKQDMV